MENKSSSSLTGPLWVIAIGILILGIGVCFTGYMLWDQKDPSREMARAPGNSAGLEEAPRSNPPAVRNLTPTPTTKREPSGSTSAGETHDASLSQSTPAPVQTPATVVLPPPPRASALPPLSGGAISARPSGTIHGRVRLVGTPPPEKPLPLDAMCGRLHNPATPPTTRFYVVSPDGGLADVLVYLSAGTQGRSYPLATNTPVIDQRGCEYVPYISGAQVGQTILVRNSDPLLHNVHPTPTVAGNPESNRAQLPKGADLKFAFQQPEMFLRFRCDVHPWMFSYVSILPHPFFAVTDETGRFQFAAPPPGKYVIDAVHRKTRQSVSTGLQREINLGANENLQIDFEITVPAANQ